MRPYEFRDRIDWNELFQEENPGIAEGILQERLKECYGNTFPLR